MSELDKNDNSYTCSFCGKAQEEVAKLVAGPGRRRENGYGRGSRRRRWEPRLFPGGERNCDGRPGHRGGHWLSIDPCV